VTRSGEEAKVYTNDDLQGYSKQQQFVEPLGK
jgi:hypothetical protein